MYVNVEQIFPLNPQTRVKETLHVDFGTMFLKHAEVKKNKKNACLMVALTQTWLSVWRFLGGGTWGGKSDLRSGWQYGGTHHWS